MEKQRKIKTLTVAAMVVAILGLTIAFAALSQTLTINGTAGVEAGSWDIHFEVEDGFFRDPAYTPDGTLIEYAYTIGNATINSTPTLNETSLTGINVTLTKPYDAAAFALKIVNGGTIDAKIESVEISELCTLESSVESCDWDNNGEVTQNDIDKVNDNISFVGVAYDGEDSNGVLLKTGDVLKAGDSIIYLVGIGYEKVTFDEDGVMGDSEEATELPERDLTFNNLSVTINYVQD